MTDFLGDSTGSGGFLLETLDTAQTDRASSSFVIDLRRSPRFETRLPASLISERGTVAGLVTNLSRSGLRFEGGKALTDLLLLDVGRVKGEEPVIVEVCFEVPGKDTVPVPVIVQARAVYLIHNDGDIYLCGVEFRAFADGEDALESYLQQRHGSG